MKMWHIKKVDKAQKFTDLTNLAFRALAFCQREGPRADETLFLKRQLCE